GQSGAMGPDSRSDPHPRPSHWWARFLEDPDPPSALGSSVAAQLFTDLSHADVRDEIIARWLPWLRWSAGHDRPEACPRRRTRALTLLRLLAATARGGQEPPVLTLMAFDLWVAREPARARSLLSRVLADHPSYRLAHLLDQVLAAGICAPGAAAESISDRSSRPQ
ncbi:MAG: DUF4192 family protein, partial [Angustibacter sp.]